MKRILTAVCLTLLAAFAAVAASNERMMKNSEKSAKKTVEKAAGKDVKKDVRKDMKKITALIDRYFDSLNETDAARRRAATAEVWAEKGKFGTPYGEVEGREAIIELVAGVQKKFPGSIVRRTSKIDGFGEYLRWSFTLFEANGTPILSGVDFAIVADGRLRLVMGFFDFAPEMPN